MRNTLKASLTAIMLTSVAAVPLATATTFLTADAAYAKSDKAKGGGSDKAKGKSATKVKGKSGERTASRGHGGLDTFFGKLTGKDKKATRSAPASASGKVKLAKSDPMHPSNLGNMNGALNSSPNAMLAHIRNGNYNGPVGHLAAFAVARTDAYGAQDVLDLEKAFADLDTELSMTEYATLEDYLAAKEGIEPITDLDLAIMAAEMNTDETLQADLDAKVAEELAKTTYGTVGEYEDAVMGIAPIQGVEDELAALGYNEEDGTFAEDRPTAEEVAGADQAITAEGDATTAILDYWNKGDETTEGSEQLLAALQAKVDANAEAIEGAKPVEPMDGDMAGDCEEGTEVCEPTEEEVAAAE